MPLALRSLHAWGTVPQVEGNPVDETHPDEVALAEVVAVEDGMVVVVELREEYPT